MLYLTELGNIINEENRILDLYNQDDCDLYTSYLINGGEILPYPSGTTLEENTFVIQSRIEELEQSISALEEERDSLLEQNNNAE